MATTPRETYQLAGLDPRERGFSRPVELMRDDRRCRAAWRYEADSALEDGALPHEIDTALESFGFPMGPFAVSDLAGLDIGLARRKRLEPTRDKRVRYVNTLADRICAKGRFGQKTGAGWYRYEGGKRVIDPEVRLPTAVPPPSQRGKASTGDHDRYRPPQELPDRSSGRTHRSDPSPDPGRRGQDHSSGDARLGSKRQESGATEGAGTVCYTA